MIRQHSSTVQKHPKHGSGAMSIQGKNCNKIHENHDDQCSVKCPIQETEIDGGHEREDPDDCGACTVSRAETRTDAAS